MKWFSSLRGYLPWDTISRTKTSGGDTDEGPVHKVFLKPYYIDRYEVSAFQFSKFLNHHQKKAYLYFQTGLGVTIEKVGAYFFHDQVLAIPPPIGFPGMAPMRIAAG